MKNILIASLMVAFLPATGLWLRIADAQDHDDGILNMPDVFDIEFATDAQISPDGKRIVYVRNHFDIMTDSRKSNLWMIDGEANHHQPLIAGPSSVNSPRWSPSGDRLVYVGLANDKTQLFCYWLDSGRTGQLSRLTETPSSITWSPDGKQLAFFMRVPDERKPFVEMPKRPKGAVWADPPTVITDLRYRADGRGYLPTGKSHLFVISADGGSPRRITDGAFDHGGTICWSADSLNVIISANRREDHDFQPRNSELYFVDLATRNIEPITDRDGPDASPALSSDGNLIGFVGYDDKMLGHQNSQMYVMNADGSNRRSITESLDRGVSSPRWSKHHGGFLFTYSDNGNTKLAVVTPAGTMEKLADDLGSNSTGRPYGAGSTVSVSNDGTIAFVITTPNHPGDVARLTPGGSVERLTRLNDDLLEHKQLGTVEELRFASTFDGRQIQGWVIKPPRFDETRKYPMILEIHGGPFADYGDRFSAELQLYASAGYVVLYVNPRGSTSYGEDFANLIHHNYPGQDFDDLISGVNSLASQGFIDEKNMFVTGGSGGGVLTSWIVGKTDQFRAAVVAKPVINWYSFCLTADMYNYFYKYWFPGFPWEYPEEYHRRSPISLVGNVTTPTMLLTGEADYRTPISETEQFYQALKLRKVETAMVRIPGASHGIGAKPSQLIAKVACILKWFELHQYESDSSSD